jgi:hypothetical protein
MFNFILPRFLFKVERWKWNPEYRIYVSNMGHFKNEHKQDLPIRISQTKGYCGVVVPNYGFRHAHRVVLLTWKPIPDSENLTVDHLDHNKRNNAVDNLEWVTREENFARAKEDLYNDAATAQKTPTQVKEKKQLTAKYYRAGKKTIFHTLDEAAIWCIKQSGPDLTMERAKQAIEERCKSGGTFCGRKWKKVGY